MAVLILKGNGANLILSPVCQELLSSLPNSESETLLRDREPVPICLVHIELGDQGTSHWVGTLHPTGDNHVLALPRPAPCLPPVQLRMASGRDSGAKIGQLG